MMKLGKYVLLWSAAWSGAAVAQTTAAPARGISLTVQAEGRYDSNIARASGARAALRGVAPEDEIFAPSASLDISTPIGPHSLTLAASAGYDFHRRNTRLDRERLGLNGILSLKLASCNTDLNVGYGRRQSDLGEIGAVGAPGIGSVSNTETVKSVGTTVSCGKTYGLRPTASISYSEADNGSVLRNRTNRHGLSYQGGVNYVHPSIGSLLLFMRRQETRYPQRPLLAGGIEDGYNTTAYGANFSRSIGARLTGSVELSYTNVDRRKPTASKPDGLNWAFDLTANVSQRLQLHGRMSRAIVSSLGVDAAYNVATTYALDARYVLNNRMSFNAGYSYEPRTYFEAQTTFGPPLTNDRRQNIFGTLSYALNNRITFAFDLAHQSRSANDAYYDYGDTRAAVRASFTL